jgi:hypothetical protein
MCSHEPANQVIGNNGSNQPFNSVRVTLGDVLKEQASA